jgi:addiction module HigA family antidote
MKKQPPAHPGEILLEEFLAPLSISQARLARDLSVPARRVHEIIQGKRSLSPDMALRLSRYFGNSAEFWLNLQNHHDIEAARDELGARLKTEVKVYREAARKAG